MSVAKPNFAFSISNAVVKTYTVSDLIKTALFMYKYRNLASEL